MNCLVALCESQKAEENKLQMRNKTNKEKENERNRGNKKTEECRGI
jgi:hypothetical protein